MSERGLSLGGYKADFSREAWSLPVFTMAPHVQGRMELRFLPPGSGNGCGGADERGDRNWWGL